jgi:DNA-binding CsgD family transcriptional regulator
LAWLQLNFYFDENDHLWHLYSSGDFLASKRLHPQPGDEVHLISIPVILWSNISPSLTGIIQEQDPFQTIEKIQRLQLREKMDNAQSYIFGSLTESERKVTALLVKEGLCDQEIAERLNISPRTVEQHLRSAYHKAASHWELDDVNRTQLVSLINIFYVWEIYNNENKLA